MSSKELTRATKDAAKIFKPELFNEMEKSREAVDEYSVEVYSKVDTLAERSKGTIYEDEILQIRSDFKEAINELDITDL
jgi:hypothetical protein